MSKLAIRTALLATLSPLAFAAPAFAQQAGETVPPARDATAETQAEDERPGDQTIVVTGTRRANRTVADSPVPVDVIGSEAISHTGQTETNKILNQLVPSFNFPQPSIADGSDALRPATLRGLGPDQTLVLINGKRRHVSALLNINGTVGRGSAAVDLNLDPRACDQPGRGASRRRRRPIWLGRNRRRHQHPAQEFQARRPRGNHLRPICDDRERSRRGHRPAALRRRPAAVSTPLTAAICSPTPATTARRGTATK